MRITPFTIFDQLTRSMNRTMEQYSKENARLTTGKKILAPSDDVNGILRALDYRVNINANDQYTRNLDFAVSSLDATATALTSISDTTAEVKSLLVQFMSGSSDPDIGSTMAQNAALLRDTLYNMAGTTYLDQYIFSGFLSSQHPFAITPPAIGDPLVTVDNSAGAGITSAVVANPAALTGAEYRIGFDAAGANYIVYNNADNSVVVPATAYNPAGTTIGLPGMTIDIAGGPVTGTDSFIIRPALSSYDYQGDTGAINIQIDKRATLPVNVTGDQVFSYTLAGAVTEQLSNGRYVTYTPGAGTTIDVEIRDTDNVTVLDQFSFSNVMEMTDLVSSAVSTNNALRLEAMVDPFTRYQTQLGTVEADVGARQVRLDDQSKTLKSGTNMFYNSLSSVEDADMLETAALLKKIEVTLSATRDSASRVLSQSLLDFLR